jgi:hypothetical protein
MMVLYRTSQRENIMSIKEFCIERIGAQSSRNHIDLGRHSYYMSEDELEAKAAAREERHARRLMIQKNAVKAKRLGLR